MTDFNRCPFCKNDDASLVRVPNRTAYLVECQSCKATGPKFRKPQNAVEAWNAAEGSQNGDKEEIL